MSPFMARAENAFACSFLDGQNLSESEKACMNVIMKHHGKTVSQMVSVSKITERKSSKSFMYEQRISLPRPCNHNFAGSTDGDKFFHGKKFVQYPDGSVHLHVELLCESTDGYHPEEVTAKPVTHVASPANIPSVPATSSASPAAACGPSPSHQQHFQEAAASQNFSSPPSQGVPPSAPSPIGNVLVLPNAYDGVAAPRTRSAKRLCTFQDHEQMPPSAIHDPEDVESVYDEYTVYSGDLNSTAQN
jgi:hypothetical protein